MINAIIVEDEPKSLSLLEIYLQKYCPIINIIGTAKDAKGGFDLIVNHRPQLLFLDIEISNEDSQETSFDLLSRLPKYNYEVIFITAFNKYAIQAIKFHALDYLLKPIDISELEIAVELAQKRILDNTDNEKLLNFIAQMNSTSKDNRIWIPMSDGHKAVDLGEVVYFEASSRYTYIHVHQSRKLLSSRSLKEYVEILGDYQQFMLIHRSYFINTHYIEKYVSSEGGYILMKDSTQIPIARRRKQEILDILKIR